jgi:hypothetical protein
METEMEEETYSKVIYIIIGILVLIILAAVMDVMTGGSLFGDLVCAMLWHMPFNPLLPGYTGCGGIPI